MSDNKKQDLPKRKKLPHKIPEWVEPGKPYFITINCLSRGSTSQLTLPHIASNIHKSMLECQIQGKWWIHLLILMPDHLHTIISFARDIPMARAISDWKRYAASNLGIIWQRDFFDHRLRNRNELTEKWNYVLENPVRKGLVTKSNAWPYIWTNDSILNI